ncbi:helix-turn-helix transcriptional regulator [Ihubacter massiliensis]|uniref:helix-turn-helix domain-containing protein n=1 Tax=Ihubacter massiliensis TaxID=1852367 RepID=UPI0020980B6B|nr:helix-turn-helix transcriptional regulator [Ihubacter massiliensis]MCO7122040.1 helix-turn-helix transcriptional regulator [Ihubacter massiliensis]
MTLQDNFSNSVKIAYKNSGKTLSEFSNEIGVSRATLQGILKGNSNSRTDTIEVVADGLNTNPLALLSIPCGESELAFILSLFQLSDAASALPDDEKEELAAHCHAIIRILFNEKSKSPQK